MALDVTVVRTCCLFTEITFIGANETVTLTSPNFPDQYPLYADVVWILQTLAGRKLLIVFEVLRTESGFDFLYVGDGRRPDNTSTGFFSWSGTGPHHPERVLSNSNEAWIHFTTDYSINEVGFNITVVSVDSSGEANISVHGSEWRRG